MCASSSTIINSIEKLVEPKEFNPATVKSIFRICATDYAQAVVLPKFLASIRSQAPNLKVIVQDIEIDNLSNFLSESSIESDLFDIDTAIKVCKDLKHFEEAIKLA